MYDLRSFIDTVRRERPRDVLDVYREVDPKYEGAAILVKLEQYHRSPLLVFHRVKGSSWPLVSNACGSMARLALAMGCPVSEANSCYAERVAAPIKPKLTEAAPVQERVWLGVDVDLAALPQLRYHENDADRAYITGAIVVAKDPETDRSNLSFHRLMITGRNTTCIFMARGKHLDRIYRKYEAAGVPMPMAAFVGVHPMCSLGALFSGPADVEEYDIIGGLQRSPLRIANCFTQALTVPADAEVVLEGTVPPRARTDEGPFGEFTGYSTGTMSTPVFHVQAITSREQPIFQDVVSGHIEHLTLPVLGMEYDLLTFARSIVPTTSAVKTVLPLTVVAAISKRYDSEPKQLIEALLRHDIYAKYVVVVDQDVRVSDLREVAAAIASHVRPDRDIYVYPGQPGTQLDPACDSEDGSTAKLGIDATIPFAANRRLKKNTIPQSILDSINITELLNSNKPQAPDRQERFAEI